MRHRPLVLAALVAAFVVLTPVSATASSFARTGSSSSGASDVAWSVAPVVSPVGEERVNIVHELAPGETLVDAVVVTNSGAEELALDVVAADALTTGDGRIDLATEEQGSRDIGTWIAPGAGRITVPEGDTVRIPFTITVPSDAVPGDHAGALLTIRRDRDAQGVTAHMRYATRVTVRVPGDLRPQLRLGGMTLDVRPGFWPWDPATGVLRYEIENGGNTALRATQYATVGSIGGLARAEVLSTPDGMSGLREISELLPGARVDGGVDVPLPHSALPWWNARVELSPSVVLAGSPDRSAAEPLDVVVAEASGWSWAPGWWILLGGVAALATAVIVNVRVLRRSSSRAVTL